MPDSTSPAHLTDATQSSPADATPHVTPPSWAPPIIALGIFFAGLGVILGLYYLIPGILIFLFGMGIWLREDVKKFESENYGPQAHGHQ